MGVPCGWIAAAIPLVLTMGGSGHATTSETDARICVEARESEPDLAINACSHLLAQRSRPALDHLTTLQSRGIAYAVKGEAEASYQDFSEAIQFRPDDPENYYLRSYYRLKRPADDPAIDWRLSAIEDVSKAIEMRPESIPYSAKLYLHRGESYYRYAVIQRDNRTMPQALADLELALKYCGEERLLCEAAMSRRSDIQKHLPTTAR